VAGVRLAHGHEWTQRRDKFFPEPGHVSQFVDGMERPVGQAMGGDPLRQRHADARKRFEVRGGRGVEIEPHVEARVIREGDRGRSPGHDPAGHGGKRQQRGGQHDQDPL